jgi:hypothetical protein
MYPGDWIRNLAPEIFYGPLTPAAEMLHALLLTILGGKRRRSVVPAAGPWPVPVAFAQTHPEGNHHKVD